MKKLVAEPLFPKGQMEIKAENNFAEISVGLSVG